MKVANASSSFLRRLSLTLMVVLFTAANLSAQGLTTAAMNGMVSSNTGEILIGATVVARHLPTNTIYGTTTRDDGRFNLNNMKPGGPYSIKVSYVGYRAEELPDIFIELSQNLRIDFQLVSEDLSTEEIVVTAERNPLISAARTGASTTVSAEQLSALPTISRSLQDFTRLTPQVSGNSIGGKNNRYNNIQVDGAVLNDVFGLSTTGTPGGQAGTQPIAIDAIQEIKVNVAPYDVRQGGFTGGLVNAITKSGSNKYSGSAYYFFRNQDWVAEGPLKTDFPEFNEKVYGFSVGGPVVKDQLFFFVNGELSRKETPSTIQPSTTPGATSFGMDPSTIKAFSDTLRNRYGYDPGSYSLFTRKTNSDKIFMRLDYNLLEDHTLTLRFNYVDGFDDNLTRTGTDFSLSNRNYLFASTQYAPVFQVNSRLSNSLTNEFRVSYTAIRDGRDPEGNPFPSIRIKQGSLNLYAGQENFSVANTLDQDLIEVTNNLTWFAGDFFGDHILTFGTNNEFFKFDNLFIRNLYGLYEFENFADFYAGKASRYEYSYSNTGKRKPAAQFGAARYGVYIQDEYSPMPNLKLTAGVRLDVPVLPDTPAKNDSVSKYFPGYRTDEMPSGNLQWSPRLGVNWDVMDNKLVQLRGGIGIFSGRTPFVWISNNYSNTGIEISRIQYSSTSAKINFIADPDNQMLPGDTRAGVTLSPVASSEINIVDPDYVFPQVMRLNAATDVQLPMGFVGSLEFIYSKNLNDANYYDLNIGAVQGKLADGRPHFWTNSGFTNRARVNSNNFTNVMLLKNSKEGYQWSVTPQIQKPMYAGEGILQNFSFSGAYTYSRSTDLNSVLSSQAVSQARFNGVVDPNNIDLATSDFELRHRVIGAISYEFKWEDVSPMFPGFATTISLFGENRSGVPYTYTYNGDINGDNFNENDLMYIPKDRNDIFLVKLDGSGNPVKSGSNFVEADASTYDAFFGFIDADPLVKEQKGKIMKRNSGRLPWVTMLDMRIAQEIPIPTFPGMENHKFEITLDILNVLDLLGDDFGVVKRLAYETGNPNSGRPLRYRGLQPNTSSIKPGMQVFSFDPVGGKTVSYPFVESDNASRAYFMLGIRYTF
ncbi:MAG: TonB-dependent receptor [Bacteroidetes bacterium]|nr:TonB-dependent receptor [Bacteroidota bacterium]